MPLSGVLCGLIIVALRKESVDRNTPAENPMISVYKSLSARRAWIEMMYVTRLPRAQVSLSARRAWIEIDIPPNLDADHAVALRKESVDRNREIYGIAYSAVMSLSARRAWIEIYEYSIPYIYILVALRKESVDRNMRTTLIFLFSPVALRKESVDRNGLRLVPLLD